MLTLCANYNGATEMCSMSQSWVILRYSITYLCLNLQKGLGQSLQKGLNPLLVLISPRLSYTFTYLETHCTTKDV